MAAPENFMGELLPVDTVNALMTIEGEDHVGGMRIPRFTQDAKDAILGHLPEGAEYVEGGGDFEGFRWTVDGVQHSASVLLDEDRLVAAGVNWDDANTSAADLAPFVVVWGDNGPNNDADQAALLQAVNIALQDVAPGDQDVVMAGGRRRRRKTRKTKGGKRRKAKTLRRRK